MLCWRDATTGDEAVEERLEASLCPWIDAVAGLPDDQRRALLAMQSRARRAGLESAWPGARRLIVEHDGPAGREPVGRLWLARGADAWHLVDLTLLPAWRGRGLGAECLQRLIALAQADGQAVTLEVAEDNPARRLYTRFGFQVVGAHPPHLRMRRPSGEPGPPGAACLETLGGRP